MIEAFEHFYGEIFSLTVIDLIPLLPLTFPFPSLPVSQSSSLLCIAITVAIAAFPIKVFPPLRSLLILLFNNAQESPFLPPSHRTDGRSVGRRVSDADAGRFFRPILALPGSLPFRPAAVRCQRERRLGEPISFPILFPAANEKALCLDLATRKARLALPFQFSIAEEKAMS